MEKYLVKANLSSGAFDAVGGVPSSIEYMPAGVHTICCSVDGKPKQITVSVDESTAAQLQASLEDALAKFEAGEMSKPFIDFDHKGEKAAAFPVKFYWADGVRLEVEWTDAGRSAVKRKEYNYFSPQWFMGDGAVAIASPGAIGALCNVPAFQKIEKISSTINKGNNMAEQKENPDAKTVEQLEAELASAKQQCATLQAQLDDLQKNKDDADKKADDAEKEKEAEAKKAAAARKELIEFKVNELVKAGRLAAAGKDAFIEAALLSADNGKLLMAGIPERASASIPPVATAAAPAKEPALHGVELAAKGFAAMLAK